MKISQMLLSGQVDDMTFSKSYDCSVDFSVRDPVQC